MAETQTAAPSSAQESTSTFEIPSSGTSEYAEWRINGTLPEKKSQPKTAESAPADTPKEEHSETAPAAESGQGQQEQRRRKPDVEERFRKLSEDYNARLQKLERDLEEARRPKETKAESSPAPAKQPQSYAEYRQAFKAKDFIEQFAKQNPEASYEDATAAMAEHLADARDYFRRIDETRQAQRKAIDDLAKKAREKYPDFDNVKTQFLGKLVDEKGSALIPQQVFDVIDDSDYLADVIYVIGSDAEESAKFVELAKSNPTKAIRYIARVESLIEAELSKPRNDNGQFRSEEREAPKAPVKRGPESAPAPPLEIGSRGAGSADEASRALEAVERGDGRSFRQWMEAENARELRRRRGA